MSAQSFKNYLEQDVWVKATCAALAGGLAPHQCNSAADTVVRGLRARRSEHLDKEDEVAQGGEEE